MCKEYNQTVNKVCNFPKNKNQVQLKVGKTQLIEV
jgi:hypothetical protein